MPASRRRPGTGLPNSRLSKRNWTGPPEVINGLNAQIEEIKKRLDDTNIPALTEQIEKKRREIEESERRLRNKEADINDAQRERQHFTARLGELAEERNRQEERKRQIDGDIAAANEQIATIKAQIVGPRGTAEGVLGGT